MRPVVPALALALALAPVAAAGGSPSATVGTASSGKSGLQVAATTRAGALPLVVTFKLHAPRAVSWRLDFGDGRIETAKGRPPSTVTHVYRTKGSFVAHLSTVYPVVETTIPAPSPAPSPATRANPPRPVALVGPLVTLGFVPLTGARPHSVAFSLASMFTGDVNSWQLVFGDGTQASGKGAPPTSVTHTYAHAGTFRAYLLLSQVSASHFSRLQVPADGLQVSVK
jgi:PKD repeat protein